ncbi:restriction endonuclease subunit S [Marinicella sediminis]|uniref:Restriction endonuclease subunit S n=1 Tax=Marinicella sediminis TaxID=1792834 RepID=A0ABV7J9L0_9GAMM|nr:restriction endonuclease subunit S [Marinicella sediminis]
MTFKFFEELFEIPLRNGLTKPKRIRGEGYKMINMGELFKFPRIKNIPMDRVPLNAKEYANSLVEPGDLLFARQSLVVEGAGQCSIFIEDKEKVCFESHLIRCRLNKKIANPLFFYYYFSSRHGKQAISAIVEQGAGAAGVRGSDLAKVLVPDIDIEIQNEIANVLDQFDNKIEINRQANQTLEHIAQAIFKSWFVDFEPTMAKIAAQKEGQDPERAAMAAISGKSLDELDQLSQEQQVQLKTTAALFPDALVDSELGEVPEGWSEKALYETAEFVNGYAFKAKDFSSDRSGLPIVKIVELKNGLSEGTKFTIGEFREKYSIKNDDVLYSWSGSPKTSLEVFKWFGGDAWLNQHIFKLNFESEYQKYFTYYLLRHMKPTLIATAENKQTTGLGHITVADLKRLLVTYPDENVLAEFRYTVGPMYEKCSSLDIETRVLAELRDALLPNLLNGEIKIGKAL